MSLGDLTVLLGANDTGKSTLLRALREDLAGRPPAAPTSEAGAMFVELSDDELERMLPNDSPTFQRTVGDWRLGNLDVRRSVASTRRSLMSTGTWRDFAPGRRLSPSTRCSTGYGHRDWCASNTCLT